MQAPRPFVVDVPDDVLADLEYRLRRTRWPDEVAGSGWRHGTNLEYLRELTDYWIEHYNWRLQEERLNQYEQYTVSMHGIDVHFIHQRGEGDRPTPLLLLHGWPSSAWEFHKILPMLADPARFGKRAEDTFTIVAPSLPGYGFSFQPYQKRFGIEAIADCLAELMTRVLGYDTFAVAGGDWGAYIAARLGYAYPAHVRGLHLNMLPKGEIPRWRENPTLEEHAYLQALDDWRREEGGYSAIQATRPQSLAYALTDSPVGLAGWIVEKFYAWSDCAGDVETRFTKDDLLTTTMVYWITGAIGSSFWPYLTRDRGEWSVYDLPPKRQRIDVPTAYVDFPRENIRPPRSIAEQLFNIRQWITADSGGHFPALEEPETLTGSIRTFFHTLNSTDK